MADVVCPVAEKFTVLAMSHKEVDHCHQTPPPSPKDLNPPSFSSVTSNPDPKDDVSVAVKVAEAMGIPNAIIKMAREYRILQHGKDFPNAHELIEAADDLLSFPEKQFLIGKKLYEAEQLATRKEEKPSCQHFSPEAKACTTMETASVYPLAEMLEKTECAVPPPVDAKAQLKEKVRSLAQENQRLRQRKLCRQCHKVDLSSSGVTFLPCGHFITCEACSEQCEDCPACGVNVMGTVRTYLS